MTKNKFNENLCVMVRIALLFLFHYKNIDYIIKMQLAKLVN